MKDRILSFLCNKNEGKWIPQVSNENDWVAPVINVNNGSIIYDRNNLDSQYNGTLNILLEYINKDDTIIDIGCNNGYFLIKLRNHFKTNSYYVGADPNSKYLSTFKYIVKNKNYNIEFKPYSIDMFLKRNKFIFDYIFLFNINYPYQYTTTTLKTIKELKHLVKKKIFLQIGNYLTYKKMKTNISLERNDFEKELGKIYPYEIKDTYIVKGVEMRLYMI